MSNHFAPTTITHLNQLTVVENAYRTAGMKPPSRDTAVAELLRAEPTEHAILESFVDAAINGTTDPEQLLEDTITAANRAETVARITEFYQRTHPLRVAASIDQHRDQAAKDLTPAFKRTVKALTAALGKLDPHLPLDREKAFDTDTTAQWKAATSALTTLGQYVFTTTHTTHHAWAGTRLLPILRIPDTTPERGTASPTVPWQPEPGQEGRLERNAIRALMRDADRDPDTALVRVARGGYHGLVTLELADTAELERRRQAYETAHHRVNTNRDTGVIRLPA